MGPDDVTQRLGALDRAGVVLDADGTLVPIAPRPELARVLPEAAAALAGLVGRVALLAVVSGRPGSEVARLVGVEGVTYVGVYGLEGGATLSPALVRRVREVVAPVEGAWVEEKGPALSVHVRGASDPTAAEERLTPPLEAVGRSNGLELLRGKYTLELAPADRPRKGAAVERLLAEHAVEGVLFAGDDLPDLEAFEALDRLSADGLRTIKVAVGGPETPEALEAAADLVVEGPTGLASLLASL